MKNQILFTVAIVAAASFFVVVLYSVWRITVLRKRARSSSYSSSRLASSLRDEKVKSDIILSAINDGVVLLDEQGTIRHFNPGASSITGWKHDEAEGLDWHSIFRFVNKKNETLADPDTPFERAKAAKEGLHDNNLSLLTKSNKPVATSFSVSPLQDEHGKVTGLVGIFRDVSDERKEENQRAEFISTASHEMRTPVAAIEGYLSLALNGKVATVDDRARDFLEKAHTSTKHLGQLFQDLLTSAKAEDGRLTSRPKVLEVGAYLEQLAQDLRFTAEKKHLEMEFVLGSDETMKVSSTRTGSGLAAIRPLYYVNVDPDRFREVITNLFDNACKYTDSGKISLGLTGDASVVQLYIRDTGAGIPSEDIPHLFQKFYRVDSSATRTVGGTGLGLFICRKIIELYQGHLWVESTLGHGSTFYINVPRINTSRAERMIAEQAAAEANTLAELPAADDSQQLAAMPAADPLPAPAAMPAEEVSSLNKSPSPEPSIS